MTLKNQAGTTLNKAGVEALTTEVTQPVVRRFTADVYEHYPEPGAKGHKTGTRIKWRVGQEVAQADIDKMFGTSTFTSVTPATGPAAGNTSITIKGTKLSGTTAVAIGGVACTDVTIVDDSTVTAKTAAMTAGTKNLVITDDDNTITATNAFVVTA